LYKNLAAENIHCALGQVKKEYIKGVLQMRRAFIAAFTRKKKMDDNQKKFYSAIGRSLIQNFFTAHLSSLV
jgi:hypothetical protein